MAREFDSPWKEALEYYLEPLLALFFPDIHAAIDWSKGYESLDKELQEIIRDAEMGAKVADKLFRVHLRDGEDVWLLIHIEVQTQPEPDFGRRMFTYSYRSIDRYNVDVVSLAILGDDNSNWRPVHYERLRFGTGPGIRFRPIKLIDWVDRMEELDRNPSPIAAVVLAHLQSLLTHGKLELRFDAKRHLLKQLCDRGYGDLDLGQLYRLIDWFLELPKELDEPLRTEIYDYVKEKKMPYITSFERLAREEGERAGRELSLDAIAYALELKFGDEGRTLSNELHSVPDLAAIREIQQSIRSAKTIDDVRAVLQKHRVGAAV